MKKYIVQVHQVHQVQEVHQVHQVHQVYQVHQVQQVQQVHVQVKNQSFDDMVGCIIVYIHMGQIAQDGENEQYLS